MKRTTLVLAFAIFTIFGVTPAQAVEFGKEIKNASEESPWVASIWFSGPKDDYYYPRCSGSLITGDAVLTAAHCLTGKGSYLVQMASDTLNGESDETFYEVAAIWKHPAYARTTLVNDVGLLKLTSSQNNVKPMAIASKADLAAVRDIKNFEIFGWGDDEYGNYARYLGHAKLNNLTDVANELFEVSGFDPSKLIAAGRYIKRLGVYAGSGDGDSGGPLVANINGVEKVTGITSWGQKNDDSKAPTAFSNVSYYRIAIAEGLAALQRFMGVEARAI